MATLRLDYDDSTLLQFEAMVQETILHDGQPAVVLERTAFYPTGGGQPHDTGTLNDIAVINVVTRPSDKAVLHVLEHSLDSLNVTGRIDAARRFDHTQQHTGQHVLTQAFVQLCSAPTVGFHLSPDTVTIDLGLTGLSYGQITSAEKLANDVIWQNLPVTARTLSPDQMDGVRMRKLPGHIAAEDGLRVVSIGDFDQTACGGTHVRATGQIGLLKVIKVEKRGDKTRIEFCCGGRALADYHLRLGVTSALSHRLNTAVSEQDLAVGRLQDELKSLQRARKAAVNQLMELTAGQLLTEADTIGDLRIVTLVSELFQVDELRLLAKRLIANDGVIALLAAPGDKAQIMAARSSNVIADMPTLLKVALSTLENGRGGGTPDFAQGGGFPASAEALHSALQAARHTLASSL